jgi:anti-sigma B factor antagonist
VEIDIQVEEKAIVAFVRGRVDTVSAQAFEKGLGSALTREENCLVLDLSGLEYISSAGLRVILSAAKTLKTRGGEIRLAAMQGPVRKVFQISGFLSLFKSFDTKASAVEGV